MIQNTWISFLQQNGAQVRDGVVSDFGDPSAEIQAAKSKNCLFDLSPLGLIRVQGEDAKTFLQNQLSNDINKVTQELTQLSAYCSAKGRVLSLFRIIADGDDYLLQLPRERIQNTIKRLSMFILMSKVSLQDVSDEISAIGIAGPDATAWLESIGLTTPLQVNQSISNERVTIVRVAGISPRYTLIADEEILQSFWQQNQSNMRPVAYPAWLSIDIQAGLPQVYEASSEAFVPQMLNLNALDAISYTKGCYPGQEVVARMHYLGKQKRRMFLGHVATDQAPQPGDNLYVNKAITDQSVGKIVHSARSEKGGYDALAVIQIKHADNDTLYVHASGEDQFVIGELPYTVELEGSQ